MRDNQSIFLLSFKKDFNRYEALVCEVTRKTEGQERLELLQVLVLKYGGRHE